MVAKVFLTLMQYKHCLLFEDTTISPTLLNFYSNYLSCNMC